MKHLTCISCRIWMAICLAAAGLIGSSLSLRAATPPGTSLISTIELSPGGNTYTPQQFGFNQTTHKLYTLGQYYTNSNVALINTTTGSFVTGIREPKITTSDGDSTLQAYGIAVDDSTTAGGNKVYYVSQIGYNTTRHLVLVTGDGATDTIDPNTAVILPITELIVSGIGVNPVNHKVYISDYNGTVAVVDGPNHNFIKTIQMPSGNGAIFLRVSVWGCSEPREAQDTPGGSHEMESIRTMRTQHRAAARS